MESEGNLKNHICAFARQKEEKTVLVIVPRFLTRIIRGSDEMPLGREIWGDSRIVIPEEVSGNKFNNIFTGETIEETEQDGQGGLALGEIFANFPVALLEKEIG
jgi:(1->4)-alpha-D-glucan 1-alpha-D-glucosylmutase